MSRPTDQNTYSEKNVERRLAHVSHFPHRPTLPRAAAPLLPILQVQIKACEQTIEHGVLRSNVATFVT